MIRFVVPGEAVGQQRTGRTVINGRVHSYDPKKSRDFKQLVQYAAMPHAPAQLLDGAIVVTVDVFKIMPKAIGGNPRKRLQALEGTLRPVTKPDNTNYAKGVEDGLNRLLWRDDAQIVTITIRKWYSDRPRTIVQVQLYAGDEQPPTDE